MDITALINHPERMDRDTLYELRSTVALYPYFQTARLLMLQNLYILHDADFDEELRRAAICITERKAIFNMVEAAHYQLRNATPAEPATPQGSRPSESRTVDLIDSFLGSIPSDTEEEHKHRRRRSTPADAAVDYMAYMLENEAPTDEQEDTPQMKGQDLIDNFLEQEQGRILLNLNDDEEQDEPQPAGSSTEPAENKEDVGEEYFTETLARIYIKQGRYQKALDIIRRLSAKYPHKNAYFNDQIRFLEKLIINNNIKNKK